MSLVSSTSISPFLKPLERGLRERPPIPGKKGGGALSCSNAALRSRFLAPLPPVEITVVPFFASISMRQYICKTDVAPVEYLDSPFSHMRLRPARPRRARLGSYHRGSASTSRVGGYLIRMGRVGRKDGAARRLPCRFALSCLLRSRWRSLGRSAAPRSFPLVESFLVSEVSTFIKTRRRR